MTKHLLGPLLLCGAAAPAFAQARCEQSDLDGLAAAYLAAQATGDPTKLPLADFTSYTEGGEVATLFGGPLSQPLKADLQRTFTDLATCQSVAELVVTGGGHPYVIATRLQFAGRDNPIAPSRVNEIDSVITDAGDHRFDAAATFRAAAAQRWDVIPADRRDARPALLAAANAWLDALAGKGTAPPLASPCERLEGGQAGACAVSATPVAVAERRFVVDEAHGAVVAFVLLGPRKLPDAHLFRVEGGRIRYVDGITACPDGQCGLP